MKTQRLSLANIAERMSRNEMKSIKAGLGEVTTGGCVQCETGSGMSSCWYTSGSGSDLCNRVYPGQSGTYTPVSCDGCKTG